MDLVGFHGSLFFAAGSAASPGTTTIIGSFLNVPNVNFTYIAFIFTQINAITSITGIVRDFAGTNITTFTITPVSGGTSTNPSIFQYTFPAPITTSSVRALQLAVTVIGASNATMNIYSISLGFN